MDQKDYKKIYATLHKIRVSGHLNIHSIIYINLIFQHKFGII